LSSLRLSAPSCSANHPSSGIHADSNLILQAITGEIVSWPQDLADPGHAFVQVTITVLGPASAVPGPSPMAVIRADCPETILVTHFFGFCGSFGPTFSLFVGTSHNPPIIPRNAYQRLINKSTPSVRCIHRFHTSFSCSPFYSRMGNT
jgi:hypothetical protein